MKIILSRKGFDSSYGGVPSPILPGIGPVSLPIPSSAGAPAGSYQTGGTSLTELLSDLTGGKHGAGTLVHLDPDLDNATRSRLKGWRPALGQVAAAQSHLANQGVGVGDLFLFFGWFRPAERHRGTWRFVPGSAGFHALFGWLQIGEVIVLPDADTSNLPTWLNGHPHVLHAAQFIGRSNTIYVAADTLHLNGPSSIPGGGCMRHWSNALKLSAGHANRSLWSVPIWLDPRVGRKPLSYHGRLERWSREDGKLYLQTVAKGQEFVLHCDDYPEATRWARVLIKEHAHSTSEECRS